MVVDPASIKEVVDDTLMVRQCRQLQLKVERSERQAADALKRAQKADVKVVAAESEAARWKATALREEGHGADAARLRREVAALRKQLAAQPAAAAAAAAAEGGEGEDADERAARDERRRVQAEQAEAEEEAAAGRREANRGRAAAVDARLVSSPGAPTLPLRPAPVLPRQTRAHPSCLTRAARPRPPRGRGAGPGGA
jgi:hypothetical protein